MQPMIDAAFPPGAPTIPPGTHAIAGYLGGHTPHPWAVVEWQRFPHLRKLPIWVPGQAIEVPEAANTVSCDIVRAAKHLGVSKGCPIVIDLETAQVSGFDANVIDDLHFVGYKVWTYGSRSTVFANPAGDGYWVADYTHSPHMVSGPNVVATQWTDGPQFDRSLVRWLAYETLWH